jgi:hypothetical protein
MEQPIIKAMVMSVGGTPAPVVRSIAEFRPEILPKLLLLGHSEGIATPVVSRFSRLCLVLETRPHSEGIAT